MCTVTVGRHLDGVLVTMNRDELRTRAAELPPALHPGWAGPRDGERGGTWFGVNPQGLVACLLNAYPAPPPSPGAPSRGQIIPYILPHGGLEAAQASLQGLDLSAYPPFLLLLADSRSTRLLRWGQSGGLGQEELSGPWAMVTSSGWRHQEVEHWRGEQFQAWLEQGAAMLEGVPSFHLLQPPGREAWAPLTSRLWSVTRSLTQARVEPGHVELRYWRPPQLPPQAPASSLDLEGGAQVRAKPA